MIPRQLWQGSNLESTRVWMQQILRAQQGTRQEEKQGNKTQEQKTAGSPDSRPHLISLSRLSPSSRSKSGPERLFAPTATAAAAAAAVSGFVPAAATAAADSAVGFDSVFRLMGPVFRDSTKRRSFWCSVLSLAALICTALFLGSASFVATDYNSSLTRLEPVRTVQIIQANDCEYSCKPPGSEALPRGIISSTSDLEMIPLWGPIKTKEKKDEKSLLAVAVGIKQKETVNKLVEKFLSSNFAVMLFHYDNVVDQWRDMHWSDKVIHVSAINQTKWWFAKRFLHPDIVSEYNYVFLWDEDIEVDNFHPDRYLEIVREEGLEISQPALDVSKSEVHHQITARGRRAKVHRRTYKFTRGMRCDDKSTAPPCTGWVEMMAPVFSRDSWRCVWHMIQNDLIHAWGLDMKLGYCTQGDRTQKVGVVDAEYIVHRGIPSLGGSDLKESPASSPQPRNSAKSENQKARVPRRYDDRSRVRLRSYNELETFRRRWDRAVMEDKCWMDPYKEPPAKAGQ